MPFTDQKITPNDLLYGRRLKKIPAFIMIPKEPISERKRVLGKVSDFVESESVLEAILFFLYNK